MTQANPPLTLPSSSTVNNMNPPLAKPSDRFIPYYIIGFFIFLMLLLGGFIYIAIRGYPGEVLNDSYQQGLHYNRIIAESDTQDKLGWNGDIGFTANDLNVRLTFTLADRNGKPITHADTKAWFIRQTLAGHDQEIALTPDGKGGYNGKTALAWKGDWEVHVSATSDGHNYQQVKEINVQ